MGSGRRPTVRATSRALARWHRPRPKGTGGRLEGIMLASQTSKDRKYQILQQASSKLDMLKVFIRLAGDVKILSDSRYIKCQNQIQEIGKMLGGWMKSTNEEHF